MIQQTSLESYQHIINTEKLGRIQQQVYKYIQQNPSITNKTISQALKIPINIITPRTNELRKKKLIKINGTTTQKNGRKANTHTTTQN